MDKFKMELTWHNCKTCPPEEKRNNTLYATDGSYVFDVIYDSEYGWYNLREFVYIPPENLYKFWWADINQTVHKTYKFNGDLND